jgi:hypothetical protein
MSIVDSSLGSKAVGTRSRPFTLLPTTVGVKNEWSSASIPPYAFMVRVGKDYLYYPYLDVRSPAQASLANTVVANRIIQVRRPAVLYTLTRNVFVGAFQQCSSHVKRVTILLLHINKWQWKPTSLKCNSVGGGVMLLTTANITFKVSQKLPLFSYFYTYPPARAPTSRDYWMPIHLPEYKHNMGIFLKIWRFHVILIQNTEKKHWTYVKSF